MNEKRMTQMIRETGELFSAAQAVGNRAVSSLGYNQPYFFAPNLTVSYELYTSGPAVPYHSQYDHLNEEVLGERVEREDGITDEQWFWQKEELFKRIVIQENEKPVFILQGKHGFQCVLKADGQWEEELMIQAGCYDGPPRH